MAEPAFLTAEDKPRTLHIQAMDKYERPASSLDREGFKVEASHGHSLQSNDKEIQADLSATSEDAREKSGVTDHLPMVTQRS